MAAKRKSAEIDRKKLFSDPVMIGMIVVLLVFLILFIVYPLFVLLIDSVFSEGRFSLDVFKRVLSMDRFRTAFVNTVELGLITGVLSSAIGLLFAYVDVYVKLKYKWIEYSIFIAGSFSAFCIILIYDHVIWQKRYHQQICIPYL